MKYYILSVKKGKATKYVVMREEKIWFSAFTKRKYVRYWPKLDELSWYSYFDLASEYNTEKEAEEVIAIAMGMEDFQGNTMREVPPFKYYKANE